MNMDQSTVTIGGAWNEEGSFIVAGSFQPLVLFKSSVRLLYKAVTIVFYGAK